MVAHSNVRLTMAWCALFRQKDSFDPTIRLFVVVDPRAGHGPGIGGFKADSEIGVASKAGHPCYSWAPADPMPGRRSRTLRAPRRCSLRSDRSAPRPREAVRHRYCQGGWAVMMLAHFAPNRWTDHHRWPRPFRIGLVCTEKILTRYSAVCAAAGDRVSPATERWQV